MTRYLRLTGNRRYMSSQTFGGMDEKLFRLFVEKMAPYTREFLKIEVLNVTPGNLETKLLYNKLFVGNELTRCMHGGVIASLLDHSAGMACWSSFKDDDTLCSTVDLRIDYLKPAPLEDLICVSHVINSTDRLIRADATVYNSDKTIKIATGRGLFNVYNSKLPNGITLNSILKKKAKELWGEAPNGAK